MSDDPKYVTHPAYGRAIFSRRFGHSSRLFGSPLTAHHTTIALQIHRASVKHDLGQDWYGTEGGRALIEVTFSPAQFAELLTNMNMGDGVPCTIDYVDGKRMPDIPEDEPVEHEKVVEAFQEDVTEVSDRLRAGQKRAKELLAKKSLTKADKEEIEWLIGKALQDVEQNAPFMLKQFGEAATKVALHAKAEVAAAATAIVEKLGIQKINELRRQIEGRRVPVEFEPEEDDDV